MENNIDQKNGSVKDLSPTSGESRATEPNDFSPNKKQKSPNKLIGYLKNHKKPIIITSVVVIIIVLGALSWFLYRQLTQSTSSTPNTRSAQGGGSYNGGGTADATGLISAALPLECVPKGHDYYRTEDTLAVDPTDPNTVYVGVEYKGFFKTTDGGTTWKESDTGIHAYGMESTLTKRCFTEMGRTVIDPADHTHLLLSMVSSPGDLSVLHSETAGVYESKDSGATWKQLLKPGMNASGSRAIAFDPKDSKTVYYGSNNMTPSYTMNGGKAMDKYFNTTGIVYRSGTAGTSWSELPTGAEHGFRAWNIGIDSVNSSKLWLFALNANINGGQPEDSAQKKSILVSSDKGATWTSLVDKLPVGYRVLADGFLSPTNGQNAFVITATTTGPPKSFATTDGGATWKASSNYIFAGSYDPNDKTGMRMLGYAPYDNVPGIYESRDGGVTWAKYTSLPSEVDGLSNLGVRISSFVWSLSSPSTVYMDASGGYVWKSTDNGKTWKTVLTLAAIGGKNKNKDGQEVSRQPDSSNGGSATPPSATTTTN